MKRKLYAKYNKRSRLIEMTFIDINDDEAMYKFQIANEKAEEDNPYYNREDYLLICLGVIQMEGKSEEVGIIYDYKDDFPFIFGEVKDNQKPKYNQKYFEKMQVSKEKEEQIMKKAHNKI